MGNLLKVSWRSIWRSKRRTAITVSAIAFALAVAVFFVAFAEGVYAQMTDDAVRMQAGHVTLEHEEYRDAPAIDLTVGRVSALREELAALEGVEKTKVIVLGQGVVRSGHASVGAAIYGFVPSVEAATSIIARRVQEGEFLADDDFRKVVVGKVLADRLQVRLGKKLVVSSNNAKGELVEELVRVKGVFATGAEEVDGFLVQVPLRFARHLYGLSDDQATQLGLVLHDADDQAKTLKAARKVVGGGREVAVRPWEEVLPDLAAYIKLDGGSNWVFQGILIFLSLFTVFNTILMSVLERKREFAVLLALGTPPWRIRAQVVVESALVGVLGCLVGLTIGGLLGLYLQVYGFDISALFEEGISVSGLAFDTYVYGKVTVELLGGLGSVIFVATVLSAAVSTRRIPAISVAEVLR